MKKVNLGFGGLADGTLLVKAQSIIAAMTGNAYFPAPVPELTVATTATTNYQAALSAAKSGNRTDIAEKNAKKDDLIQALVHLGNYVMLTAKGDEVILVSSGYALSRVKEPSPPLVKPEIIKVEDGSNSGELLVMISAVKGARTYVYQYTKDPLNDGNEWTGQNSTLTKNSFRDLESGKKYWCRVVAYGVNEQIVFSDPVSRIVQ